MLRKVVFLERFFGIAFLYTDDQKQACLLGFWRRAGNNSSGDLHGPYVKQTKALSLIRFGDKDKGKVLEAFFLSWTKATEDEESEVLKSVFPF